MLRDVTTNVLDGQLGLNKTESNVIHVKIGASPIQMEKPITVTSDMSKDKIMRELGNSPLADSVNQSFEWGARKIICLPTVPSTAGAIGTVAKESAGSITVSGYPQNSFSIVLKIIGSGGLNAATFMYSIDGGYSYSDEITVPLSGQYTIPQTGINVVFTLPDETIFSSGDHFSFGTTEPKLTNAELLSAANKLSNISTEYEFVHIVGETSKETWAAISSVQTELTEKHKRHVFFILESYAKKDTDNLEDYVLRLKEDRKAIKNFNIQVVVARSVYKDASGVTKEINNAGIVAGMYAKTAVNKSIGEVSVHSISSEKMLELRPVGIEEYLGTLDVTGYLTFRDYYGLDGFYVTNARMMCPTGSDYRYAEDVRVLNKIQREVRKESLLQLQSDVDTSDVQGDLDARAKFIQAPLDQMIERKEITSATVSASADNILVDGVVKVLVKYVSRGKIREIIAEFARSNPNA